MTRRDVRSSDRPTGLSTIFADPLRVSPIRLRKEGRKQSGSSPVQPYAVRSRSRIKTISFTTSAGFRLAGVIVTKMVRAGLGEGADAMAAGGTGDMPA
jgi:hypothetical protein